MLTIHAGEERPLCKESSVWNTETASLPPTHTYRRPKCDRDDLWAAKAFFSCQTSSKTPETLKGAVSKAALPARTGSNRSRSNTSNVALVWWQIRLTSYGGECRESSDCSPTVAMFRTDIHLVVWKKYIIRYRNTFSGTCRTLSKSKCLSRCLESSSLIKCCGLIWRTCSRWTDLLTEACINTSGTPDLFLKVAHINRTRHVQQVSTAALAVLQKDTSLILIVTPVERNHGNSHLPMCRLWY